MNEPKHTAGKVRVYQNHGAYVRTPGFARLAIERCDAPTMTLFLVISDIPELMDVDGANAQRLVSCWNACEGLNPEAIQGLVEAAALVCAETPPPPSFRIRHLREAVGAAMGEDKEVG